MKRFFDSLDDLAGIDGETAVIRLLDRTSFIFLVVMVLAAPYSIAATQIAWGIGMLAWIVRSFVSPRQTFKFSGLIIALFAFFGWSVVSSLFSYDQATSVDRLKGVALLLIFVFVASSVRKLKTAYFLAFALVFSCTVLAVMSPIQRLIGRGVEIHGLQSNGPLAKLEMLEGDTLLKVNGKKLNDPEHLIAALEANEMVGVTYHRPDAVWTKDLNRADLLPGVTPAERLGFTDWEPSHYWRVAGFYSHYTTLSEVLQLIASLVFGLIAAYLRNRHVASSAEAAEKVGIVSRFARLVSSPPFLIFSLAAICLALLLTVTRASQLSFMISSLVIVLLTASRKFIFAAIVIAVPIAFFALVLLQESRQVGFIDSKDESTLYRTMMWRDGARLLTASPRNFVFGIGMDSVKNHWQEFDLYDKGWQPMGHFHSTPVQLAVERGLPALLLWLTVLAFYARSLLKGIKKARGGDWTTLGILLGCAGGLIGFCTSGLAHWNLGDAEVAMVFYMLMGIGISTAELSAEEALKNGSNLERDFSVLEDA